MATYDGHATKRQRTTTDSDGRGVQSGARDKFEDPHKPPPSPVVHVRGLSDTVIEADLVEAVQHFGPISYVIMMPRKRQALIEFEDIDGAQACVNFAQQNNIIRVGNSPAYFNFSTSQRISRPGGTEDNRNTNHILLVTVINPRYPITTDVVHTICNPFGPVQRIVIFRKNGVQTMVEFDNVDSASRAKASLNGADIYSGCCTLKIEYARPTRLNVYKNDSDTFDYTNPTLGTGGEFATKEKGNALLEEPRGYQMGVQVPPQPQGMGQGYNQYSNQNQMQNMHGQYGQQNQMGGQNQMGNSMMGQMGNQMGGQMGNQMGGHMGNQPKGSPVVMVYGMDADRMNCDKLFNVLCLYGNVVKIKFMKSKPGCAMVQMGDALAVERAITNLNNVVVFDKKMQLGFSKQMMLADQMQPSDLPDGSACFKDFTQSRNNRFSSPEAASKNRIQQPAKVLHFFNAHPDSTDSTVRQQIFIENGVRDPISVKMFTSKSERSASGLVEWENVSDAIEAVICCNHVEMPNPSGRYPYTFKLCFSSALHAV
ncbi:heterogeneous nuclear ribonucleoprotein L-like isoform X2 [Glandiceps talaboti]